MDTKRYLLCELGDKMILLGKQGESGALRIEFDCAPWLEEYPAATIKLFVFNKAHRQDDPILPVLGSEGTLRVWIVGEDETATSGHGVIELVLLDAGTGSTLKSATGYTTVIKSPSAGIEAREAQAGYVRYDLDQSEILTEEQKAIARNNIGAGTGSGTGGGVAVETDPTVPSWAKQKNKPSYTAAEVGALPSTYVPPNQTAAQVGADPAGTAAQAIGAHDVDDEAHEDIRALIVGLTNRLNALANSDDTTLDQMAEVVAYIKNNKTLIDGITTGKVSTSDIVNNLTTNVSTKVLSAAQGVALKALIDAIVIPSTLPNPQPIVINGESYDGSAKKEITIQPGSSTGGAAIDDTTPSTGTTYSSSKIDALLNEQKEANEKQDEEIAKKASSTDLAAVAKSGSYNDLTDKPTIPTVPTKVTAFENDAGYLTKADKEEIEGAVDEKVPVSAEADAQNIVSFKNSAGVVLFTLDLSDIGTPATYGNIILSAESLTIAEGESGTFTVKLDTAPSGSQVIYVAVSDETRLTFDPPHITFTAANWDVDQTVTVTAAQDEDETDDTITVTLTSRKVDAKQLSVIITDDDVYVPFGGKEIVSLVRQSTFGTSEDKITTYYDEANDETITQDGYAFVWPFKTGTSGANLQGTPTKARSVLEANTTGAYSIIDVWDGANPPSGGGGLGALNPNTLISAYGSYEWETLVVKLEKMNYRNTAGELSTVSLTGTESSVKKSDLPTVTDGWTKFIVMTVFTAAGEVIFYGGNVEVYRIAAPEDFVSWDWDLAGRSWADLRFTPGTNSNAYIIVNDAVTAEDITEFYEHDVDANF